MPLISETTTDDVPFHDHMNEKSDCKQQVVII